MIKFIANTITKWLTYERPVKGYPKCDFDRIRYELRPCDVILVEGRSRISEVIKTITQSSWSHSALYLGRLHDIENEEIRKLAKEFYDGDPREQLILEGVMGQGTIINPLSIYEKDHIRICRPHGLSPDDAQRVISIVVSRLGTKYDVRQIFDLARFMLPWSIFPRKWRSRLFRQGAGESVKTVCSTVIAEAFNAVDFPILPYLKKHLTKGIELIHRNPRLFTPRDFDYSPYFEIMKYPFIELDNPAYRNLPWNREGLLSHDEYLHKHDENIFNDSKQKLRKNLANSKKILTKPSTEANEAEKSILENIEIKNQGTSATKNIPLPENTKLETQGTSKPTSKQENLSDKNSSTKAKKLKSRSFKFLKRKAKGKS